MVKAKLKILYSCCLLLPLICGASDITNHTLKRDYPDAPKRTFIQNYKDMVFASCLTKAYNDNKDIVKDIGSSEGALQQWVSYDINESVDEEFKIVNSYLSRNYFNPIVEEV
ncbi:type VI secretion system amidase immunity protein Tai4 [Snodgrassella alvi]|uniref:type VI secretion system amidase immunity protein Tai4 n=1 Tax=Snodgrassella alvi TaxID=1196083 RepID=UPI00351C6328